MDQYINEEGSEIKFKTAAHARHFSSLLVDFLTPKPSILSSTHLSRLTSLIKIAHSPSFKKQGNTISLKTTSEAFDNWINTEVVAQDVNFSEINLTATIRASRWFFIRTCGTIGKHNEMSLDRIAKQIHTKIRENGCNITRHQSYVILDNYYDWFYNQYLVRYVTHIAKMLNDIRHSISDYVNPERQRTLEWKYIDAFGEYAACTVVPSSMENDYSRHCYNSLINLLRTQPYFNKFEKPSNIKGYEKYLRFQISPPRP